MHMRFGNAYRNFVRYLKSVISLEKHLASNIVNLSRANPRKLEFRSASKSSNDKYKYLFHRNKDAPALCLTVGLVMEDHTKKLISSVSGVSSKFVAAIPLTYEYERLVATIAMTLGVRTFKSQVTSNMLMFSTRPDTGAIKKRKLCALS